MSETLKRPEDFQIYFSTDNPTRMATTFTLENIAYLHRAIDIAADIMRLDVKDESSPLPTPPTEPVE